MYVLYLQRGSLVSHQLQRTRYLNAVNTFGELLSMGVVCEQLHLPHDLQAVMRGTATILTGEP